MTGNKGNVQTQGPKPLGNAVDELLMIAFGKICAPYRALKNNIAHHGNFILRLHKHNMDKRFEIVHASFKDLTNILKKKISKNLMEFLWI